MNSMDISETETLFEEEINNSMCESESLPCMDIRQIFGKKKYV